MRSKGFLIVFSLYVGLMLGDFVTTLRNGWLLSAVEANPIYLVVGSIWPLVLLNFVVVAVIFWVYVKGKPMARFVMIHCMVAIMPARLLAIRNALSWSDYSGTVEQAAAVSTPEVKAAMYLGLIVLQGLPLVIGILSFWLWKLDHHVHREEEVVINLGKTRWFK